MARRVLRRSAYEGWTPGVGWSWLSSKPSMSDVGSCSSSSFGGR
jgi:hypothetical protein